MNYSLFSKQKMCIKHKKPVVVVNSDPNIGPSCLICVQHWPGKVSIEQFNKQQQALYEEIYFEMDFDHQQFQTILDELLQYKQNIIISLDKIIQIILDQIKIMKDSKMKMSSIIQQDSDKDRMMKDIQQLTHKQILVNRGVKVQVGKQLLQFQQKFSEINELSTILESNNIAKIQNEVKALMKSKIKIQQAQVVVGKQFQKIQCEQAQESIMKQENRCFSFAFNNDNTILLVGCEYEIVVYEFINGKISKELQRLNDHITFVYCLYFMKKSNSFVSGSSDSTMLIWKLNQNNQWVTEQVLKEQTSYIN